MRLFRIAEENVAPAWAFGESVLDDYKKETVSAEEAFRLASVSEDIDEITMSKECEIIETCASQDKPYKYNVAWDKTKVKQLKEYALACGMKMENFKAVSPETIENVISIESKVSDIRLNKIASATGSSEKGKIVLADPFHIEERTELKHMEKDNWQEINKSAKLSDKPSMLFGVKAIRGGDDYFTNADTKVAKNQNSIADPNAIKKMIESEKLDNGARLANEKLAKAAKKIEEHKQWEKDKISSMEKNDIIAKGKVFPTETLNAQSGIKESVFGVYSKFDPKNMPEKTAGEMLKEKNAEYHKSINPRSEKTETKFEVSHQSSRKISDDFAEQLKKFVK